MDASHNAIWRWLRWPAICCLLGAWWACGGGDIDEEDELGAEGNEDSDSYELVILEPPSADSAAVDTAAAPRLKSADGGPAATPAPEKTAGRSGPAQSEDTPGDPVVFDPQGDFTIQIGHYQDAKAAARMVRELDAEGYPVYAIASPDGKGVRVRIGYFKTRQDAQRFGQIFKADRKLEFWVDSKASEKQGRGH